MDNVCHTLVGAALAEAGLKQRTALGAATLMIGANLPDIDALAVPIGHGIDFRRGWTHGVLALVVLPFALTAIMLAWDRWVTPLRARRTKVVRARRTVPRELLLLSAISILTHPTLDWMNEYGMRWLMPFVDKWFYADGLFIIDIWILAALILGVAWSRRDRTTRPARVALAFLALYTTANLMITGAGRARVSCGCRRRRYSRATAIAPSRSLAPSRTPATSCTGPVFPYIGSIRTGRSPSSASRTHAIRAMRRRVGRP
jgi:inner membrane protein